MEYLWPRQLASGENWCFGIVCSCRWMGMRHVDAAIGETRESWDHNDSSRPLTMPSDERFDTTLFFFFLQFFFRVETNWRRYSLLGREVSPSQPRAWLLSMLLGREGGNSWQAGVSVNTGCFLFGVTATRSLPCLLLDKTDPRVLCVFFFYLSYTPNSVYSRGCIWA